MPKTVERDAGSGIAFTGRISDPFGGVNRVKTMQLLKQHEESALKVAELLNQDQEIIQVSWLKKEPLRVLHLSDFHLFDLATSGNYIKRIEGELSEPGTVAVLYGDMIQGILPSSPEINTRAIYNFQQQISIFKERCLRSWVEKGKILGVVTGFDSHEGWAQRILTLDAVRIMTEGLVQPDGTPLQTILQGGRVIIELGKGKEHVIRVYHDPGSGGSDGLNPVGSQRARDKEYPLDAEDGHDSVVGGHYHHRAGVSEEVFWRADSRNEKKQTLVATGTAQDVDETGTPNLYLRKQAKGVSVKGGAATILIPDGDQMKTWSFSGVEEMHYMDRAARIWDAAEKNGMTDEIIGMAKDKLGPLKLTFHRDQSFSNTQNYRSQTTAPLFDNLDYQVREPGLPVAVCFMSNARYGSTSTNDTAVAEAVKRSVDDDRFLILAGRHMVDSSVSRQRDRLEILGRMSTRLAPAHEKGRMVGLMLSKSLREDGWKTPVGSGEEKLPGLSTGDFLYFKSPLKGLPLYENQTRINLTFNRSGPEYRILVMDGLDQSGSSFDPFRGLVRAREQSRLTYEVVTGGNGRGVGVMTSGETVYLAPGWYAKWDTRGKVNTANLPLGGNGWIMHPTEKMVIGAPTFAELSDRHRAMMLLESTKLLGIETAVVLGTRRRSAKNSK